MDLVNVVMKRFWLAMWPRGWCVTWVCRLGLFILSHHPAKFGVHRPCESGDITFFVCHVTTLSKCHVILWVGFPHPNILNLMELEIMALVVSVQFQFQFQCRGLQMAFKTLICEKKIPAEVLLIHAEQMSLYNFIVLRKNHRHSWRLNNWSKTF